MNQRNEMSFFEAFLGGTFIGLCICAIAYGVFAGKIAVVKAQEELRTKCNSVAEGRVVDYSGELDEFCGEDYSYFIKQ